MHTSSWHDPSRCYCSKADVTIVSLAASIILDVSTHSLELMDAGAYDAIMLNQENFENRSCPLRRSGWWTTVRHIEFRC